VFYNEDYQTDNKRVKKPRVPKHSISRASHRSRLSINNLAKPRQAKPKKKKKDSMIGSEELKLSNLFNFRKKANEATQVINIIRFNLL